MNNPLFSIIIPVYCAEKYLDICIESIRDQSHKDYQVVLIDDGSPDQCHEICDKYALIDDRISVIHQENRGVSIARQVGVKKARGQYLVFVDSDDWVEKDFLNSMKEIITNYSPDIICFGGYLVTADSRIPMPFPMHEKMYDRDSIVRDIFPMLIEDSKGKYFPNGLCHKVIRKELFMKNQVENKRIVMGEDAACVKPCIYHAYKLYIDSGLYYNYRRNESSVTVSGRPLLWDGPMLIAEHYDEHINLSEYDFKDQVYRNTVHNLFNVAVSQFNREESFFAIVNEIRVELANPAYSEAIRKAKFHSISGIVCEFSVRYRIYIAFYFRWLQKYGLRSRIRLLSIR